MLFRSPPSIAEKAGEHRQSHNINGFTNKKPMLQECASKELLRITSNDHQRLQSSRMRSIPTVHALLRMRVATAEPTIDLDQQCD